MKPLSNLAVFVKTVELGSFSAAARHYDLTPSAVSRQISQLEDELNIRLFNRSTRQQSLTEAGSIYYDFALRILAEMAAAETAVGRLSAKPSGLLHVTVERDFAQAFIQPRLAQFLAQYPEINLRLSLEPQVVDLVNSAVDIAIRVGQPEDRDIVAKPLLIGTSVVCASPSYFAKYGTPEHPNDLSQHQCLSFRDSASPVSWQLGFNQQTWNVAIAPRLKASSLSLLRDAACQGVGIILVPHWLVEKDLAEGRLVPLPFTTSKTPVNALYAHRNHLAPKVRAFLDFFAQAIKNPAH